jgi:hypothetical protein
MSGSRQQRLARERARGGTVTPTEPIDEVCTCQRDCDLTSSCACCGRRNHPGHAWAGHIGFAAAADPTGEVKLCDLCIVQLAAWPSPRLTLTLMLNIPAAEALSR